MTHATHSQDPAQRELLEPAAGTLGSLALPAQIRVGPFGIAEDWLLSVLRIDTETVRRWHGDELGSPRDYTLKPTGYFYTASGIRRILELTGRGGIVDIVDVKAPAPPPRPRVLRQGGPR